MSREMDDARLVRELGAWFDLVARDLPWRRTDDPYAIWLSEVMLQQTRVDTVVGYFERFMARFPNVNVLAEAPLGEVLSLWSGLGYYRRARELHVAAREVTERYGGHLPATAKELRALRGIGRYTAGAIASIAYGKREPLVDGNVARVLARLFAVEEDVKSTGGQRALWALATRLVPSEHPGRFNQALMELGAIVCTPRAPRCEVCPVAAHCGARALGRQGELPKVARKKRPVRVAMLAAVVSTTGAKTRRVLLARRARDGLFGGLWEPPMVETPSLGDGLLGLRALGIGLELRAAGSVTHVLSHRELVVSVMTGTASRVFAMKIATDGVYEEAAWIAVEQGDLGMSTLARKLLKRAL
jgi:A/G-specific adenine glycosylase